MATITEFGLGTIGDIDALDTKVSDAINVSGNNAGGIISLAFGFSTAITTAGGKFKLMQSVDGVIYDAVRDNDAVEIEVEFPVTATTSAFIVTFINVHATFLKVLGTDDGTDGVISSIKAIAK